MVLKYLFFLILFYFIVRASGNLVRAVRGGLGTPPSQDHFDPLNTSGPSARGTTGRSAREDAPPNFWGKDIEDATWEDLD